MTYPDVLGFLWSKGNDKSFKLEDSTVGNLEFNLIDTETHEWKREVTSNPVENGSPISDHIIDQPDSLTITGMISNAPILGLLDEASGLIDGSLSSQDYVAQAFDLLDNLRQSKQLIKIYTRYKTYSNMVLQSVSIPRTPDIGDSITVTIQAISVRIVNSQKTTIPTGLGINQQSIGGRKAGTSNSLDKDTQQRGGVNVSNGKSGTETELTPKVKSILVSAFGK